MNTPEPISLVPEQDRLTGASFQLREERMTAHRPVRARRERRFEFGFFIRKVVNGWLAFYKQFPPSSSVGAGYPQPPIHPPPGGEAEHGSGDEGQVLRSTSHPKPGDDTGPIGETRIEVGMFVRLTTESTESADDDES